MRAVAVAAFGEEPRVMDLPQPKPGSGELLVHVRAAGVNPLDFKIASGRFRGAHEVFPLILGSDAAGTVEAVGPLVQRFKVGDRVFGQFLHDPFGTGTYAEYVLVPENIGISRIPEGLSDPEAAALPTAGMTALVALDALAPPPGSIFVVVGASGGVGSFAVQLASARQVRVIAVARASSRDRLMKLGASDVVDISSPDWTEGVRALAPHGADAALDLMSDPPGFLRTASVVRAGGRAGSTIRAGPAGGTSPGGVQTMNINLAASSSLLERLVQEVVEKRLAIPIERTVSLEDAPAALAEIQAGKASGKVVILL